MIKAKSSIIVKIDTTSKELKINKIFAYSQNLSTLNKDQKRLKTTNDVENNIRKYKAAKIFVAIEVFISMITIEEIHEVKNRISISNSYKTIINDLIHKIAYKKSSK